MLKFLKGLFGNPYDKAAEEVKLTIIHVEAEEQAKKDISEPVISFVQCVKDNRKRFVLDYEPEEQEFSKHRLQRTRKFKDLLTGDEWSYKISYFENKGSSIYDCPFLTDDEQKYIIKQLTKFYGERRDRLWEIRRVRRNRKNLAERQRLMEIYCKGEIK